LIYVNGTLSVSQSLETSTMNTVRNENFIGMGRYGEYSHFSNILLDEIKLFNKELTPKQVLLDMNASDGIAAGIC
jgi:hypothetical protein